MVLECGLVPEPLQPLDLCRFTKATSLYEQNKTRSVEPRPGISCLCFQFRAPGSASPESLQPREERFTWEGHQGGDQALNLGFGAAGVATGGWSVGCGLVR